MVNKFSVRCALHDLVEIGNQSGGKLGHPCSELMRTAILYPNQLTKLVERIASGESVEYRINGVGLRLCSHEAPTHMGIKILVYGEQAHLYEEFVFAANQWLKELRFQ